MKSTRVAKRINYRDLSGLAARNRRMVSCFVVLILLIAPSAQSAYISVSTSTSTSGTVYLTSNVVQYQYNYIVEVTGGDDILIHAYPGYSLSGMRTIALSKPNGTYKFVHRHCQRLTGGWAGNCQDSSPVTVTFNRSSRGAAVETEYTYDTLGRLTRVKQNGTVSAGYCYDDAGNRETVDVTGGGENCASAQPLSAPTGLTATWIYGRSWEITWDAVENATHYVLTTVNGQVTIQGGNTTVYATWEQDDEPIWIKACDESSCSSLAFF